jgi:hypothetical protein
VGKSEDSELLVKSIKLKAAVKRQRMSISFMTVTFVVANHRYKRVFSFIIIAGSMCFACMMQTPYEDLKCIIWHRVQGDHDH